MIATPEIILIVLTAASFGATLFLLGLMFFSFRKG